MSKPETPTVFQRKNADDSWETVDANGKPLQATTNAAPTEDTRTIADLTKALEAKGITIPSSSKRDDLVKLAADNGV